MDRSLQHAFEPEEVMAYLDGELEPRRAAALDGHLEHCTECQELAKSIRQISTQMLGFEIEAAPQNLTTVVFENLKSSTQDNLTKPLGTGHSRLARWREFFAVGRNWALAAGLAMVIGIAYLGGSQRASMPQPNGRAVDQIVSMNAEPTPSAFPASPGYKPSPQNTGGISPPDREALAKRQAESSLSSSLANDNYASTPPPPPPP